MDLFDEIKTLTKKLVSIPSMNATSGERDIADAIEAYLRDIPYFKAHPELVITQDLKEDPMHRRNVMALLKGGDGGPIGSVGVFPTAIPVGKGEPEIGYWIAHPYWGQGLVPEAVEELLRWQFQEMGVQRVWCAHSPENEKSRRVQEKCGFRHVCDTPPSPWPDGTERPGVCQAITRQEWEVRHGG